MPVVWKGEGKPHTMPTPDIKAQPILKTESSNAPGNYQWTQNTGNRHMPNADPRMPTCGTHPEGSTDIEDPNA